MGMNTLFSAHADFTGLVEGADSLKVSKVIHKTFIDVNEEGSEAAGATGNSTIQFFVFLFQLKGILFFLWPSLCSFKLS